MQAFVRAHVGTMVWSFSATWSPTSFWRTKETRAAGSSSPPVGTRGRGLRRAHLRSISAPAVTICAIGQAVVAGGELHRCPILGAIVV
jgi:hypothetical protein